MLRILSSVNVLLGIVYFVLSLTNLSFYTDYLVAGLLGLALYYNWSTLQYLKWGTRLSLVVGLISLITSILVLIDSYLMRSTLITSSNFGLVFLTAMKFVFGLCLFAQFIVSRIDIKKSRSS